MDYLVNRVQPQCTDLLQLPHPQSLSNWSADWRQTDLLPDWTGNCARMKSGDDSLEDGCGGLRLFDVRFRSLLEIYARGWWSNGSVLHSYQS